MIHDEPATPGPTPEEILRVIEPLLPPEGEWPDAVREITEAVTVAWRRAYGHFGVPPKD